MMILMALRGISEQERSLRAGKWFDNSVKAIHTRGTTLGIIGMGTIGQEVARHMQYFGMKVIYNNRSRLSAESEYELLSFFVYMALAKRENTDHFLTAHYPPSPSCRGRNM